ncbi:YhdP family protein [Cognatishimia activa]|uniref:YhdP family protein n=1 Tax=Cognatishimia activa TaxID=1715691 RepID=UPI00071D1AA8|nr:AsmA-like C-terminal region-containing protein [Cognatishimia activa]
MTQTQPSDSETAEPDQASQPKRKRHWSWWTVLGTVVFVLVLCVGVVVGLLYSHERAIQAPDWLRNMAVDQFSRALPDADVSFDNLTIEVEADWHPRILLERVVITPKDGGPAIEFSEAETSLSYTRLLQRQVAPRDIRLSGVFLTARREAEGEVAVSVGNPNTADRRSTALSDVVNQIDDWLTLPQFERLNSVDVDALTVQFDDLRANRSWTVDGGQMQMRRDDDQLRMSSNLALLGGRDYVSTIEFNYESTLGETSAAFGVNIEDVVSQDIASQSPALTWLNLINAPISGAMRVAIDDDGNIGPLSATLQIDEGVIQPEEGARAIPLNAAQAYLTFAPETNTIVFNELYVDSPWVTARAEGKALLEDFETGLPNALVLQMTMTELSGNPADLFDAPFALEHAQADFRLQLDPFELHIGEMLVQDRGQSLVLNAKLGATEDDWIFSLNGRMDALEASRVVDWWPENAVPKTRKFVAENIYAGWLENINLAVRSVPGSRPDVYLDFGFRDASVRYSKTLPIVTGGRGQAVLEGDRFVVMAHEGIVAPGQGGVIDVSGTSFVIPNTRVKPTPAEVNLKTDASVTATLALLDYPPLSFISKAKLPVDLAEGNARIEGQLKLPLKKKLPPEDVVFAMQGELTDVKTGHFVKDKVISSPRLRAVANNEKLTLEGSGRIGAVPFQARFEAGLRPENEGRSSVTGTLDLNQAFVDEFKIGLTPDMISGQGTGEFALKFKRGEIGRFEVSSDLVGLRMGIPSLGWSKSANRSGTLEVVGRLGTPLEVTKLALATPGLEAEGTISLKNAGGLDRVSLSQVRVGNWLNGSADLIGRAGATPNISIRSGTLDLRNAPAAQGNPGGAAQSTRIEAALDRVTISDGITLTDLRGTFATGGGFNGELNARVNGGAQINGVIVPRNGRSAVRIRSNDAGGTLRSAGILKQAVGGDLDVTLIPTGADGEFDGRLKASSVRVKDAPAMAELLNAISVVGLIEQLGGEGIAFADVNAEFKLTPTYAHLTQGSAAGPSMGISMDGIYNLTNGQLDMQGVVSPIYLINAIGRPVSKRGEGLFGFNYSLRGSSENPSVSVNPLSVLTPGFLRDIFRRPTQVPSEAQTEGSDSQ